MTLQEQIENIKAEYISGSKNRAAFIVLIENMFNVMCKQSEMLNVAKGALHNGISDIHYVTVPYEIHEPNIGKDLWNKLDGAKKEMIQSLATIEQMEKL